MSEPKPCPHCTKGVETDPAGETSVCGHCDGAAVEVPCCTDRGDSEPCESPARYADGTMPRCWLHAAGEVASPVYPRTPEADAVENRCGYCNRGIYDAEGTPTVCPYCDGAGVNVPWCGKYGAEDECGDPARLRVTSLLGSCWRCPTHAGKGAEEVYPRTAEAQALWDAS